MKAIHGMLLVDWYERKMRNWPLHKYGEIAPLKIKATNLPCLVTGSIYSTYADLDTEDIIGRLHKCYPFAEWILNTFRGEVILAGGAVCRLILDSRKADSDADFFFVGCTKERIDQILRQVFTHLKTNSKHFVALRNSKTTTFCVDSEGGYCQRTMEDQFENGLEDRYQFIHSRSYPSTASVIGGFDVTVAACFTDGKDIWMTSMCAFSIRNRINILDPSRRSTTYESRLRKYSAAGISIVFPFAETQGIIQHYRAKESQAGNQKESSAANQKESSGDSRGGEQEELPKGGLLLGTRQRHEVVKGLEIWIPRDYTYETSVHLVTSETKNPRSVGDYGPHAIGLKNVRLFNGVLANRGDLEGLTWYGREMTQVFDEPDILVEYPDYFTLDGRLKHMWSRELILWLGHDESYKIIAKLEKKAQETLPTAKPRKTTKGSSNLHRYNWLGEIRTVWAGYVPKIMRKVKLAIREVEINVEKNGVTYIGPNDNPGRQHTSSFNPVYGNVREYYSPIARTISMIGIRPTTWLCLKQAAGNNFPRDVLNYICRLVVEMNAEKIRTAVFPPKGEQKAILPKPKMLKAGKRHATKKVVREPSPVEESDSEEM